VLSDNWFPGWHATVDGHAEPVLLADGALRGIAVPAGRHTVEMEYSPASIRWGSAVSLLAFLSLAAIALTGWATAIPIPAHHPWRATRGR
jgi:uncharacterized membrane protein YfhO